MKKLLIIGSILLVGGLQASSDTAVSSNDHVYLREVKASPRHKFSIWGGSASSVENDVYVTEHRNNLSPSARKSFSHLQQLFSLTAGACVLSEEEAPQIHAMVAKHAKALGVAKPLIMLGDSKSFYNAMATGFSKSAGVIFIFEDLMDDMTDKEFEGVICHELAHVKHEDLVARLLTAAVSSAVSIGLAKKAASLADSKAEAILFWVGTEFLTNMTLGIFHAKLSRWQEKNADIGGAYNKEQARNLANAMRKFQEKHDINDKAWDTTIEVIKNSQGLTDLQRFGYLAWAKTFKFLGDNPMTRLLEKVYTSHPKTADRIEYLIEHEKTLTQ